MAITQDAFSSTTSDRQASPRTLSHTVGAGSDVILYAFIVCDTTTDLNPAVTYNGVAMTLVGEVVGQATAQHVAAFRLVAPDAGTHDLSFSYDSSTTTAAVLAGLSLFGVDQADPDDAPETGNGTVTVRTETVTSETGDLVLDVVGVNSNPTITPGGSQTELLNVNCPDNAVASAGTMGGVSKQAGGASITMEWTWTGNQRSSQVAFNVNAAAEGGGAGNVNLLGGKFEMLLGGKL